MNKLKRCKTHSSLLSLSVLNDDNQLVDKPADKFCRLLGGNISQDLTWRPHLVTAEKALLPNLRKQLEVLAHLSLIIPQSSRKILAEGLVLSQMKYLLPLWGGTVSKYQKKIQVVINKVARSVTGRGRRASSRKLLLETGWLSGRELAKYFSLTEIVVHLKTLQYMYCKLKLGKNLFVTHPPGRTQLMRQSYRWWATACGTYFWMTHVTVNRSPLSKTWWKPGL